MTVENDPVDIVMTWVDGNDPAWLKEKMAYSPQHKTFKAASSNVRFRDWDNVQYIFRGIEKFMPWVHKVYFVTWGHVPAWLNTDYEKLVVVNHKDFIPEKYLPTFNTNAIELNFHRIPGLSECFINFNDDTFVIGPTKKEDFFVDGKPCTTAVLSPYPINPNGIAALETNNMEIINQYFSVKDIKKNKKKWINRKYGKKVLRTLIFMHFSTILGIFEPHTQHSFKKSTYETIWKKEAKLLDATSSHKFRTKEDVTDWLIRHWQIMEGDFEPRRMDFEQLYTLPDEEKDVLERLKNPGPVRLICINDSLDIEDFERMKETIKKGLNELLPEKSGFER